ncbi:unnamed protein product [Arabis nemorensis]|uniref:OB domain-containing protein n=1 Tax=Arabis nemorensis TaxID=586526 RepID=A0A565C0U7_9BRAS|nr:unnamed protein product [Arabis nemorensis]
MTDEMFIADDRAGLAGQKLRSEGWLRTGTESRSILVETDGSSSASLEVMVNVSDGCLKIPIEGKRKFKITVQEMLDDDDEDLEQVQKDPFSDRVLIESILGRSDGGYRLAGQNVRIGGWVKTGRLQRKGKLAFLEVNDGSCSVANLQVLVESCVSSPSDLSELIRTGTSVHVDGRLKIPPVGKDRNQKIELDVKKVIHVGTVDPDKYPLPKTKLTPEYLSDFSHLRPRTNLNASVTKIRHGTADKTH